jgi:hypothetical protein
MSWWSVIWIWLLPRVCIINISLDRQALSASVIWLYITNLVFTHIFIGSSALNVSIYSENRRGIYFSPQKRLKHGRQSIMLHWINGIIRNNKCIFTKLNAVFILKTAAWTLPLFFSFFVSLGVHFRTFDVILQWRQNMCHVIFHV